MGNKNSQIDRGEQNRTMRTRGLADAEQNAPCFLDLEPLVLGELSQHHPPPLRAVEVSTHAALEGRELISPRSALEMRPPRRQAIVTHDGIKRTEGGIKAFLWPNYQSRTLFEVFQIFSPHFRPFSHRHPPFLRCRVNPLKNNADFVYIVSIPDIGGTNGGKTPPMLLYQCALRYGATDSSMMPDSTLHH